MSDKPTAGGAEILVRKLDAEQPVYGLRSRGTERDEKPNWSIEEMARDYLAAVREVWPSGPYRLGGWSLGGVVAFEMAARRGPEAGPRDRTLCLAIAAAGRRACRLRSS